MMMPTMPVLGFVGFWRPHRSVARTRLAQAPGYDDVRARLADALGAVRSG